MDNKLISLWDIQFARETESLAICVERNLHLIKPLIFIIRLHRPTHTHIYSVLRLTTELIIKMDYHAFTLLLVAYKTLWGLWLLIFCISKSPRGEKTKTQWHINFPGIFNWHSKHNTKYSVLQNHKQRATKRNTNEKVQNTPFGRPHKGKRSLTLQSR